MPREVHETYEHNPDDPEHPKLTGYVVITRESAWDDKTRARALSLTEYEDSLCPCGCGLPREVSWKKQKFKVHDFVCYAGQAIEVLKAMHREEHKGDDAWFRGRHYYAVPVTETEDQPTRSRR